MKFLVSNYSCLQNPMTRGLPPPDPHSLCPLSSTEFVEPPPPNKIPGYATDCRGVSRGINMSPKWLGYYTLRISMALDVWQTRTYFAKAIKAQITEQNSLTRRPASLKAQRIEKCLEWIFYCGPFYAMTQSFVWLSVCGKLSSIRDSCLLWVLFYPW